MKFFITFALFFLASYIFCQTILTSNTSTSSSNVNGVTTTITTQTVKWSNGSTVVTKTVNINGVSTVTVSISNDGSTPAPDVTLTGSSKSISNNNGEITEIVTNTYSNATTVTIKTVTQGSTITKTTTVAGPSGTNTWTEVTTGSTPSTTSTTGGSPTPSTPAPSTPAPSTPAPSTPAPSTPSTSSGSNTQNPVTLPSSDVYASFNYKVPSSISYADIRSIHLEYINGARDCMGIQNATWDDTIAAHAQTWANTCQIFHASGTSNPPNPFTTDETVGEGENIYTFSGTGLKATDAMVKGLLFFNGESSVYNCESNSCSGTCGHYTQNVWYKSTRIGCGVAECNGGFYGVCRYAVRGNFNWPQVHPFGSAENCKAGVGSSRNQGFDACKARIQSIGRSLSSSAAIQSASTTSTTQTTKSAPFFTSDSQIVVFALAIVITVIVAACFIVLVVISKRNPAQKELDYRLLESK